MPRLLYNVSISENESVFLFVNEQLPTCAK